MSKNQLAEKDVVGVVESRISKLVENGKLHLPKNYSAENALKAAWLVLQETKDKNGKPVLAVCNKSSIANALLRMIIMGFNPLKKQCDFIAYGKMLVCQPEYFGNIALVKRKAGAEDVYPHAIYKGDEFEYETENGITRITKHKTSFENKLSGEYLGGYVVIKWLDDRPDHVEIMTMDEIEQAWKQGPNYKGGYEKGAGTHGKFTEEMIKKTVVNRACKRFINSSDDSDLLIEAYNEASMARAEHEVQEEIEEHANSEFIDIDLEEEGQPEPEPEPQKEPEPEPEQENQEKKEPVQQQLAMTGTDGPGF